MIKEVKKTEKEWLDQAVENLEDARYSFAVFVDCFKRSVELSRDNNSLNTS